ncbi:hypothetical protein FD754_023130 [Muntiacus muntjak]|uniref:Uncharacterized protein n=1 Tax=Muntiacus muntjak TaxID=9888 RepID=A0A5N3UUL8_MUNMU|nr:hypothetical protein FD754_023131 [Muntiacus muntjak]KAB0340442.1 hypothetical protein FD754_023130 [Muntiacus muntjak]
MSSPLTAAPARGQGQGHMESETQPEEGRSCGGLWNFVVVIPGDVPGKEVALFRVEAVWKSRTWRGQNWWGSCCCWFQLLVVDTQEHSRTGAPSEWPVLEGLEVLAALQVEMSSGNEKDHRTCAPIRRKNQQRKKAGRSAIIQGIPGFWAKAIMNHPQVSIIISNQDKDLVNDMMDWKLSEGDSHSSTLAWKIPWMLSRPWSRCKLIFSFWNNPYLCKTVIIKEYYLDIVAQLSSQGAPSHGLHSNHNCPGSNRIAEIIDKDLLISPLQHYPGRSF